MPIPSDIVLDAASDPQDIERRSFALIDAAVPEPRPFSGALWTVARRCIHTLGDVDIVDSLRLSAEGVARGIAALRRGCTIFTDTRMAAAGMPQRRLEPLGVTVEPMMALPRLAERAAAAGVTRARAAVELLSPRMGGQIVVIGNAPTALLALLEYLDGMPEDSPAIPALIVGMPVGFVNAAQSKEWLSRTRWPQCTLLGCKGGSAVAAACVNALAELALAGREEAGSGDGTATV